MPKMTDPKTGETKEISMEEFMEVMKKAGNKGGMQQIVTDADGNRHVTDVYGNMSGLNDGMDRSVNIFLDKETFNAFIYAAVDTIKTQNSSDYNESKEKNIDRSDQNYIMTVDFTDSPMTSVLTCTDKKVELCVYIRDERKSNSQLNQKSEWIVDDKGHLQISAEDIKNDVLVTYFLAFREMRRFLRKTGDLERLKELNNRGAGVVLTGCGKGENLSARIVRGKNRPDLPCEVFLLGEQMMRPYPDEIMTDFRLSGMTLEDKTKAAEDGDPDAMEYLAQSYLNGYDEIEDFEKSAYWWRKFAETGNVIGQFNIGLCYAKGCGVERDFDKAAEWMKLSAENGDADAITAYETYKGASEALKKAESGDAHAQAEISKLYIQLGGSLEQFGIQKDYEEAFRWAKLSADQNDLDGMYNLALCYEHGRGTPIDQEKAVTFYEKAAKLGHVPSQWNLAVCYINGQGRDRNDPEGYVWAYKAADQGYELAINGLKSLQKTVPQVIEYYKEPDVLVYLEGTQYNDRAARCEDIVEGTVLQHKITKDKEEDVIELFYNEESVGILAKYSSAHLIALLKMNKINLKAIVKSCIPKSQRGPRARAADVKLKLEISENQVKSKSFGDNDLIKEKIAGKEGLKQKSLEEKKEQLRSQLEERKIQKEKTNSHLKEIIFTIIIGDEKKTIADLQNANHELRDMSIQELSLFLSKLVSSGDLECIENVYYMLPGAAEQIRKEEEKQQEELRRQEIEMRNKYESINDSLKQTKIKKKQAETNVEKIQAEILELETELEKQNKKLLFKDKSLIEKLNNEVTEKRIKLKEAQDIREQCSQYIQKKEEELQLKYAPLVQEENEQKRREFALKYPHYARMDSSKKSIAKQLLFAMNETEWVTIEALHEITFFRNQDISFIIRELRTDGLVEFTTEKKHSLFKLSDTVDVKEIIEQADKLF